MSTFLSKKLFNILGNTLKCNYTAARLASAYKAAVCKTKESTELEIEEKKRPKLKDHEVRVQVAYCSVNTSDLLNFAESKIKFPFVPGYELSGEVIETGKTAEQLFKKNDRVVAMNFCNYGGLASECIVDYQDLWVLPSEIQLKDAAVIAYGHSLALYTFGILAPTKESNTVVVSVGPAGVGLAAVDVAANVYKAKVIAVTDTEKNSELTRERGAFATMHYQEKVGKNVLDALGNKKADIIYDAVGGKVHDAISSCISDNGKIFTPIFGQVNVPPPHATLMGISLAKLREQNLNGYRQVVMDTLEMVSQGVITAHISEKFDFKDVNKALEFIKSKQCTGKVVVKIN